MPSQLYYVCCISTDLLVTLNCHGYHRTSLVPSWRKTLPTQLVASLEAKPIHQYCSIVAASEITVLITNLIYSQFLRHFFILLQASKRILKLHILIN